MNTEFIIAALYESKGQKNYGKEIIDQTQHALQCATLAERAGASPDLITAALLHDIGHLVDGRSEMGLRKDLDRCHEAIGSGYLTTWFSAPVVEPVFLHVAAKRYLCAKEDSYFNSLSPASIRSLELQGGPLTPIEADAFIKKPYAEDAVLLRRWDDLAKEPNAETQPLVHFLQYVVMSSTTQAA